MFLRIAHIGVAVKDMKKSVGVFQRLFGKSADHLEEVADQDVQTAHFKIGETAIELVSPSGPGSTIAKFIEKRGEGIHHLSFVVENIEAELQRLKEAGFQLIDEKPRLGSDGYLVAFLHPKSTNGVLVEISQKQGTT
ncbi:MAG TPA: methylmalonyl-CoA epimerase [Bacteroidota bacterium]|nr:methylmalonyl-CoA epimerase [Bacteroidota bacterium]